MDVCDDADYSQMVKKYSKQAQDVGVPAITSTGVPLKNFEDQSVVVISGHWRHISVPLWVATKHNNSSLMQATRNRKSSTFGTG